MEITAGTNITVTEVGQDIVISASSGASGIIIAATDSGDHQNYALAHSPTTVYFFAIVNDGSYLPNSSTFPFSVSGTTLTFNAALPSDIAATPIALVCV